MTKKKDQHPADAAAEAGIAEAVSFMVTLLQDGQTQRVEGLETLEAARAQAAQMAVGSSRKPGVYAVTADGKAHLVPSHYGSLASLAAAVEKPIAAAEVAEANAAPRKPAKAAKKAARAKKAAKPKAAPKARAKAKNGPSKTDIAVELLTRPQGATRKEVTDATEWPSINLKPIAKRRHMKLVEKEGVLRMVAA
jgi:nucleoid-associated protein YgaU